MFATTVLTMPRMITAPSTDSLRPSGPGPSALNSGTVSPRSRFHLPTPSAPKRNPRDPLDTTGARVEASQHHRHEVRVLAAVCEVRGGQELARYVGVPALLEAHQERQRGDSYV